MGNRVNCFRGIGEEGKNCEIRIFDDVCLSKRIRVKEESELNEGCRIGIDQCIKFLYFKLVVENLRLESNEALFASKTKKNKCLENFQTEKKKIKKKIRHVKNGNSYLDQIDEITELVTPEKKKKHRRSSQKSIDNIAKYSDANSELYEKSQFEIKNEEFKKIESELDKNLLNKRRNKRSETSIISPNTKKPSRYSLNLSELCINEGKPVESEENTIDFTDAFSPHSKSFNFNFRKCKIQTKGGREILRDFSMHPFSGEGKYIFPDKTEYEGQWFNNKMHGFGQFKWPDGRVYKGKFVNGHKEGPGEMTWKNGQFFKGYWKAGKQHGEGILSIPSKTGIFSIEGVWENGIRTQNKKSSS